MAFSKPFGYKVLTIFITHSYHFTTFRRLLVSILISFECATELPIDPSKKITVCKRLKSATYSGRSMGGLRGLGGLESPKPLHLHFYSITIYSF